MQNGSAQRMAVVRATRTRLLKRSISLVTTAGFLFSTLATSFTPAFAQTITDPTAPIEFQPRVTSSGNGTPTVDIVKPGQGGISHNKFREYNIDTRGLILNNSGVGGASVLGGAVAANPNLAGGRSARIILNEVTGTNRSLLNGMTEVFGTKADVIVANPNGVGCVGCGFINTGSVTLSSGVPDVDASAGAISWQTRSGDVTIADGGVSAPAGQPLGDVNLIGRTVSIDGVVKARETLRIIAGATRYDDATGQISALSGIAPVSGADAIVSTSAGTISAGSIMALSSDVDMGVVLSGNLQATGSSSVAGDVSVASQGALKIVSAQATGGIALTAARRLSISRDLAASGNIAIAAEDASLLASSGVSTGEELSIITVRDLQSAAILKAGGALTAKAGGDARFSGLAASSEVVGLEASGLLSVADATLQAPQIRLAGRTADLVNSWLIAPLKAEIVGTDVALGSNVLFDTATLNAAASDTLTIGTTISDLDYRQLDLAFKNLVVSGGGAIDRADIDVVTNGSVINNGILRGRDSLAVNADNLTNTATGVIAGGSGMRLDLNGDLSNLGKIISAGTLRLIAADLVANSGLIQSDGQLELKADVLENTGANTKVVSGGGLNIEASARLDNVLGRILALGPLILRTSGTLTNTSGAIETTGDLHISATDLVNSALAGTDGGTQDVNELGDLNILYATERTSGPARYWGTMRAARDEYSGTIQLNLPGMVRAGGNMRIEGRSLENLDGRILAAGDLSIKMDRTLNDALTYTVDHYRHEWGGGRRFMDNGSGAFHAPVGGHPDWLVSPYSADVFKSAGLDALARGGQRMVVISSGKSPVTVTYAGKGKYQAGVISSGQIEIIENADIASLLDLEVLGVDPDNVPSVIMIGNRRVDINSAPYGNHRKTLVGKSTVSVGSLIKSGGDLLLKIDTTTNRGTLAGNLVAIEGGRLNNGAGGDFVFDDVYVPVLDFGPIDALPSWSPDPSDFGRLEAYTGSLEAASLLRDANIAGSGIRFFADPVAEAAAFADAMRRASGRSLTLDGLGDEEARQQLYKNAQAFADATGSRYGVGLTEAQRAALTEPLVWHETRIVDGASVLVPVLYLPSADDLLRGGRGAGLVAGNELVIKLDGRLTNKGAIVAKDRAAVTVRDILNERAADHGTQFRADGVSSGAFGRGDTGLISAGRLLMTTDGDLINRGGAISTAGAMDLRIGGHLVNETMKNKRAVDFMDGCIGKACGTTRTDWNVAQIASGADLTVIVGGDLTNRGGSIGAVNDMLLAAAGEVTFETLQDTYLLKDYRQRGFLSGLKVVAHAITTQEAAAETLLGDMKILAGYSLCDGGDLCRREGAAASDAIFNGAMVSAYGALAVKASGDIDMGTVSAEVVNSYRAWGFQGLGWGSVKRGWNEIDTRGTRLSGDDITLSAGGAIDGVGVKIAAASDLMLLADEDIRLSAAQDARWFTEKGFYIGLSFPGSGAVDAALNRGSTDDVLTGLADLNPLTQSLARLAHADSGLAAGLAAVNTVTGGASVFGGAIRDGYTKFGINGGSAGLTDGLTRGVDPLGKFRGTDGGITPGSVLSTVGLTISSWKKEQGWSESMASELVAGGDVVMRAGLDAVLDQGTKLIAGGDVTVEAERDILMAALVDYARDKSSSFGMSLSPGSLGVNVGKSKGYDEVLTNAGVAAGGDVRLTSGRDTTIAGGNVSGKTVSLDVNRNLAVLSPQAQGWRDGFSFGLSVGLNPSAFSISGSKEDGAKSWSSGSSVIARDSLDVVVGEDTLLQGALLQATDGDILLETGTLTVSDNHDMDRYGNVGGTVGFKGGAVDTVGFSYEKKDRQGETRTTLDAAGMLGVTIRDADRAVAEQLIASVNRDAASWQEVTRDAHTKLSGDLNVRDLAAFSKNAKAIADYVRAVNAIVPDTIAAQGPESVDYFRRLLASGFTTDQAGEALRSPEVQSLVSMQQNWNGAVDFYGSPASVPLAVRVAVAQGVNIDFSQGEPAIRIDCGPYGSGCYFQVMWNGSVDTAGGEQAAIDLVAKAEEDIRRLQPEYVTLLQKFILFETTIPDELRMFALAGELEQAYFAYLLCADNVDAALLSSKIAQIGEQDLPYTKMLVDRARERVTRVDIRYGGVETADGVFDVALAAGSVVTIAGKFVVVNGVKVLRTAAGLVVPKGAADYFKAKGVTIWDSVGNLSGRTTTNSAGGGRFRPSQPLDASGNPIIRTNDRGSVQVQPNGSVTCGQHSCGMVLNTQGNPVAVDDLIRTHPVTSSAGTTMPDLQRLLRDNGVSTVARTRRSVSDLESMTAGGRPSIAMVRTGPNTNHYVVVDGVTTRSGQRVVVVRDPAGGPNGGVYYETVSSFEGRFTGNAIQMRD